MSLGRSTGAPRRPPPADPGEPLADALDVVASGLRAGLTPTAALELISQATAWGACECERIAAVQRRMRAGRPTKDEWCRPEDRGSAAESYRAVGALWDLALQTGGPLADAVGGITAHLREEARLRGRLEGLAAGPRTSRRLLTALPVAGPVLAIVVGAEPADLYASSVAGAASALVGVVLTVAGWWWSRAMVDRATRLRPYPDGDTARAGTSGAQARRTGGIPAGGGPAVGGRSADR